MKKILILGDYPLPNETITGGIMRSIYLTVNALSKSYPEYDFHVLTITDEIDKSFELINKNLTIHYVHFPLRNKPILVPKFLSKQLILHEINKIADYFICLAFDSRINFIPVHIWIIPGSVVNHLSGFHIKSLYLEKWMEYEKPLGNIPELVNKLTTNAVDVHRWPVPHARRRSRKELEYHING